MSGNTLSNLWLIGASPMAQDYARVLKSLNAPFKVIGSGESSANRKWAFRKSMYLGSEEFKMFETFWIIYDYFV